MVSGATAPRARRLGDANELKVFVASPAKKEATVLGEGETEAGARPFRRARLVEQRSAGLLPRGCAHRYSKSLDWPGRPSARDTRIEADRMFASVNSIWS